MTNQTNQSAQEGYLESSKQLRKTIEKLNKSIEENNRVMGKLKEYLDDSKKSRRFEKEEEIIWSTEIPDETLYSGNTESLNSPTDTQ